MHTYMKKEEFNNSALSNVKRQSKRKFKRKMEHPDSNILNIWIEAWENGHDWAEKAWINTNIEVVTGNFEFESLKKALMGAFIWEDSPEKHDYWQKIYESLDD